MVKDCRTLDGINGRLDFQSRTFYRLFFFFFPFFVYTLDMAHTKSLEAFYSLLDQYKQVAFPSLIDQETSPAATFDLFDTVEHIKHIPDQVI